MLKIKSAYIKHKGMLADKSTKIELILPELTLEEASILQSMIYDVVVDIIMVPAGGIDLIEKDQNSVEK